MEGDFIKINEWLTPLSWLYGLGVRIRNLLFEIGFLKERSFRIPIISVGNITVGGAGKTPHVEYLIRLLSAHGQVAVLSRGYKRHSKGYRLAISNTPMQEIGDEPYQMKEKFPKAYIAVNKKRTQGIERLIHDAETKDTDVILLDDAFQHRYVKPGVNILLVDYHRLIIYDKLIPAGRLREPLEGKNRADIVIITKCPSDLKPMDIRVLSKAMNLYPYQELFFTTIQYEKLKPYYNLKDDGEAERIPLEHYRGYHVLLLTGIASPKQLVTDLASQGFNLYPMTFRDHHDFTSKDIENINQKFAAMPTPKIVLTTEKDAARLQHTNGLDKKVEENIFALPIRIKFMLNQEQQFNQKIISYVRKNSRNSILAKRTDDHTTANSHHLRNRSGTISF